MSDYANKLSSIAEKKQKLFEEEKKLVEKRKKEIGDFAERFNLLTASDALIAGLFQEANESLQQKTDRAKGWESAGGKYLKSKSPNSKTTQAG